MYFSHLMHVIGTFFIFDMYLQNKTHGDYRNILFIENPLLSLSQSCSSSKEGERRDLGDDYYSESDYR